MTLVWHRNRRVDKPIPVPTDRLHYVERKKITNNARLYSPHASQFRLREIHQPLDGDLQAALRPGVGAGGYGKNGGHIMRPWLPLNATIAEKFRRTNKNKCWSWVPQYGRRCWPPGMISRSHSARISPRISPRRYGKGADTNPLKILDADGLPPQQEPGRLPPHHPEIPTHPDQNMSPKLRAWNHFANQGLYISRGLNQSSLHLLYLPAPAAFGNSPAVGWRSPNSSKTRSQGWGGSEYSQGKNVRAEPPNGGTWGYSILPKKFAFRFNSVHRGPC